jgi:hypothetical protein
MLTVAQSEVPRKAFYCTFHGLAGVLTKPAAHVLFLEEASGAVVTITQADAPALVVNGEVALSMRQWIADTLAGGAARLACQRQEGRQ